MNTNIEELEKKENVVFNLDHMLTSFSNLPVINRLNIGIVCFIKIIITIIAFYLCWECNQMSNIFFRIVVTGFSTIFSEIYIIYYALYHVFMGVKCYTTIGNVAI